MILRSSEHIDKGFTYKALHEWLGKGLLTSTGTIITGVDNKWLMEPGGSMPHSRGLSNNPYLSRINQIPRIDTYFFKVHFNIVLSPKLSPS